ncbi:LuxR family transcriptional regulator [Planotetraspora phitsanulokensis]|uniref:Helix-turn-helix transcriptional regulator n=3 Tax=Planotetraspora phitsanulokensis TaxID=575192 RepID=A0A8J3U882_9ACTN|nr:helix-turn-helix transcriptional regulator [Planotetraspora phitsanulokensis]
MLGSMEVRSASPVFVGRGPEVAELTRAVEAADNGTPQTVLVRGEAGVGKTRLIEELLRTVEARAAVVAVGGCVEVGGDGIPFAPFSSALRALWQQLPEEVRAACAGQEELLARMLPDLRPSALVGHGDDDNVRLFELTARILERLAESRLIVLVIEDLQWADASSRHLLGYLFRSRRNGCLLIIASYRSDDIHRRHPLRSLLAEVDRLRSVRRIEVRRFDRVEVFKQLTGVLHVQPDPHLLSEIFERSDGNAFFVEELARSYLERGQVGLDDLRDLLLVRLESLTESSQRVARFAAEGGSAVGYRLLQAVAGLPEDELVEALRGSVLAQILVPDPDISGYRFRHSLVREAVSDTILPGERSLINRRYAEALEADASLARTGELATRLSHHWYHAHDDVKALQMSLSASVEARSRYAYAEQLRSLERAMDLWNKVPDQARLRLPPLGPTEVYPARDNREDEARVCYVDLLAAATTAARQSGDPDRALNLAREALQLLSPDREPLRATWFLTQQSLVMQELNRSDGWQELNTALDLVRDSPPSAVQAEVLVQVANWRVLHGAGPESMADVERAVDCAVRVGAEDLELNARITRCRLKAERDVDGESLAELYEVRRRAESLGAIGMIGRVNTNLVSILEGMGRSEELVAAAHHGIEVCRSLNLAEAEAWVHGNLSVSLFSLGRWAESDAALDEAAAVAQSYKSRGLITHRRAHILLARGEVDAAASQLAVARRLLGTEDFQPQLLFGLVQTTMELAGRQGQLGEARAEFLRADTTGLTTGPVRYSLPMLCAIAAIEADNRGSATAAEARPEILAAIRRATARLDVVFPTSRAFRCLLDAQLQWAETGDGIDLWAEAVAAFDALQRPYELGVAHLGHARSLLAAHQRGTARDALIVAHRIAGRLGAGLLSRDVEALAQQANIALADKSASAPQPSESQSLGLTQRESEVLGLIAAGYSNRRIAEKLYITQKTTSTHVSNILAKLGVSSRTEAAAIAYRRGLVND